MLVFTLLVLLFFSGDLKTKKNKTKKKALKKKALKMTSQLVIFRAFLFIFFRPPDPRSGKKNPVNQLIKKFWPYQQTVKVTSSKESVKQAQS